MRCSSAKIAPTPALSRSTGRGRTRHAAFTLVEVLAATLLIAIVLPSIMQGVSLATRAATSARYRNEATSLAQDKLSEVIATGGWQSGSLSGDFNPNWPRYRWTATVVAWTGDITGAGLEQVDLRVIWTDRNHEDSITLSTLVYPSQTTQTSTSTSN